MKIALVQTNQIVGDFEYNLKKILDFVRKAKDEFAANIVVFPEMTLCGYPCEDLALRTDFVEKSLDYLKRLNKELVKEKLDGILVVVGGLGFASENVSGFHSDYKMATNNLYVLLGGETIATYTKRILPNYGVFDDYRIFAPGNQSQVVEFGGQKFALLVCEDTWQVPGVSGDYKDKVDFILSIHASPYWKRKTHNRYISSKKLVEFVGAPLIYVNQIGGQDELVFDGDSFVMDKSGVVVSSKKFEEDIQIFDTEKNYQPLVKNEEIDLFPSKSDSEIKLDQVALNILDDESYSTIYNALVLGLRDYVQKNNFKQVVLGVSGGIDSAIVATIASDAIGGKNVFGVAMPSKYSSDHSVSDAETLIKNINGNFILKPIGDIFNDYQETLDLSGISEENLQARIRGVILMGITNQLNEKNNTLALVTGNKSELAVGYSTAFGDTVGGFDPIKDLLKTEVFAIAKWRNENLPKLSIDPIEHPIPDNSITKAPSAELRPNQKDEDSLGKYSILDEKLIDYVENREKNHKNLDIINKIDQNEWKRRIYPLGIKISKLGFGKDRRIPITNHFTSNE